MKAPHGRTVGHALQSSAKERSREEGTSQRPVLAGMLKNEEDDEEA